MTHNRSPEAKLRRTQRAKAKEIMLNHAFNDRLNGDVVNLLHWEQVVDYVTQAFPTEAVVLEAIPCAAERGVILSDPKGNGAFQQK